jgi:hypothetical protein
MALCGIADPAAVALHDEKYTHIPRSFKQFFCLKSMGIKRNYAL